MTSKNSSQAPRNRLILHAENITNVHNTNYPGTHCDAAPNDESIVDAFTRNMQLSIKRLGRLALEFDLVGVDASFANALRRILIAEIPTMAIEDVFVMRNTSIIADEILAHRLGLIPLAVDPRAFDVRRADEDATDLNTIVFSLRVRCDRNPKAAASAAAAAAALTPEERYVMSSVTAKELVWQPQGRQAELFAALPIRPVHDDILIAKLRPNQEIDVELHARKGIGKDHAKWSPVATASYRLLPEIVIKDDIFDADAEKFAACFAPGVVRIEKLRSDASGHRQKAVVADARRDTVSRECLRHAEFAEKVELRRVKDHFIFTVESTGALSASDLVVEACRVLIGKCQKIKEGLARIAD